MNNLTSQLILKSGLPRWATDNEASVNAADKIETLVKLTVEACIQIIEETGCYQTDLHTEMLREAFGIKNLED